MAEVIFATILVALLVFLIILVIVFIMIGTYILHQIEGIDNDGN
jgi:uncharacterized membrane protein